MQERNSPVLGRKTHLPEGEILLWPQPVKEDNPAARKNCGESRGGVLKRRHTFRPRKHVPHLRGEGRIDGVFLEFSSPLTRKARICDWVGGAKEENAPL